MPSLLEKIATNPVATAVAASSSVGVAAEHPIAAAIATISAAVFTSSAGHVAKQHQERELQLLASGLSQLKEELRNMRIEQISLVQAAADEMMREVYSNKLTLLREVALGAVSQHDLDEHMAFSLRKAIRDVSPAQIKFLEKYWRGGQAILVEKRVIRMYGREEIELPRTSEEYSLIGGLVLDGLLEKVNTPAEKYDFTKVCNKLMVCVLAGQELDADSEATE